MNSAEHTHGTHGTNGTGGAGTETEVTVLGLGLMGAALADAMLTGGRRTTVWNRTPGKAEPLTVRGAAEADGIRAAVTASPLVIVCIRDYTAVRDLLDPVADALAGRVLVNLTTGSSEEARVMAEWAAGHGAGYLDGAIMMTPPGIGAPETVIFYGGDEKLFRTHEPVLRLLGGRPTHLGEDTGTASLYDVALLGLMWGTFNSFLHALALVETEGTTATEFLPLATDWLTGVSSFMGLYAQQIDAGEFVATDASLATQLAPVEHLVHESRARGVDTRLPEYTRDLIADALAKGHGLDSYARIIDHFRTAAS
ncbi:NAD(P)-binding domain-containing protein [Streptomyces sp. N2-109]|uniref:NAD(P)-binding domain-containing protein n=1 Tax=Streptomyces gossypii TaxID=2883101 RepID=A0ABT2JYN0_9ACTN|nr:NAD(P)-binding domain-containing protein [Streptomyces gossypii]MCT2593009.1 NAD(P)-binding domain-containing protein [Streptomyces gossypii]MCT2593742.1 NAD(P)-binding domain-containing protein [Streptomyces gossypii]